MFDKIKNFVSDVFHTEVVINGSLPASFYRGENRSMELREIHIW